MFELIKQSPHTIDMKIKRKLRRDSLCELYRNQNKPTDGFLERKIIFLNSSKIRSPAMFDIKSCGSERMVSLSVRSIPKPSLEAN